jgi:choline dehydrogenase
VIVDAMKLSRRLAETEAMKPYFDGWEYPDADIRSDDELLEAARELGNTTFHVMGTCRMGPDTDPTAVVDDRLRVRGLENLRVIDASIMPAMVSANLNASAMMIGEKGADLVMGRPALEPIIVPD